MVEEKFLERVRAFQKTNVTVAHKQAVSAQCFSEATLAPEKWWDKVRQLQPQKRLNIFYRNAWKKLNKTAGFPPAADSTK